MLSTFKIRPKGVDLKFIQNYYLLKKKVRFCKSAKHRELLRDLRKKKNEQRQKKIQHFSESFKKNCIENAKLMPF